MTLFLTCTCLFFLSPYTVELEPYYQTENEDESPFICSQPRENGMRYCRSIPTRREEGLECTLDYYSYNYTTNTSCVNWNQYYTNCSAGEHNPFKGAINFDNIGYAWIAIFQVNKVTRHLSLGLLHGKLDHNWLLSPQKAIFFLSQEEWVSG